MTAGPSGARKRVRAIFADAPFIGDLGIELKDLGPGWCETILPVVRRHLQQDGYVHAGVQATLADHTAGGAAATVAPPGHLVLSIEFKINLLRPAVGDLLRCRAAVIRPGRTIAVAESEVFAAKDDREKLVAKAIVTLALVPGAPGPRRPGRGRRGAPASGP